jgi:hypothetical protein
MERNWVCFKYRYVLWWELTWIIQSLSFFSSPKAELVLMTGLIVIANITLPTPTRLHSLKNKYVYSLQRNVTAQQCSRTNA